jgi:hypothetical protein
MYSRMKFNYKDSVVNDELCEGNYTFRTTYLQKQQYNYLDLIKTQRDDDT